MPEGPSGTVTFLFTDMEGSTRRWEEQPAAMAAAIARHDALLRRAIEASGGYIFKTVGDAFCAAFTTATDALAASLDAQAALVAEAWDPALGGIRVRIGLHTGAAGERDGDYFGPPVNRAARLASAAAGGQVVLSSSTQELVRDSLPPGVELRDLGSHRLKDLIRPEQIFQVVAPGLPADFPPLRTLDSRPHNLPRQTTALIGREHAVADVVALLRQPAVALVTLTGPGGTGKTRLGLQVAAELLEDFADGAWFVELAPISDSALVASAIATTLGVRETVGKSLNESLKDHLLDKRLLLVLDNFEQVTAAAPLVSELLAAAPGLKVLATSRIVLHLRGEKEYAVPPLALPDPRQLPSLERLAQYEAVRLFIERAQDVKPEFAVTNANAPAVAGICARLDGLPLAIELAAARSKLLTPEAILARLENRLDLLTGGARDLPARQQTLRGAIAWSYDLLAPGEQQLFRRLGVFVGGCTLAAAEAVCNPDGALDLDVFEGLAALVDKSLLRQQEQPNGELRFGMLETIREYGLEQLAAGGELEPLRRAHAAYYLVLAEHAAQDADTFQETTSFNRLEREHDNLRAVLAWAGGAEPELALRLAAALGLFWHHRSYFREGQQWLATALARTSAPTSAQAQALLAVGALTWARGDYAAGRRHLEASVACWRALRDAVGLAAALTWLGMVVWEQGEYPLAHTLTAESVQHYRQAGESEGLALALRSLGFIAQSQGDYPQARTLLRESVEIYHTTENIGGWAWALLALGETLQAQGEYEQAAGCMEESLQVFQEDGDRFRRAWVLHNLGQVRRAQGDYARAEARLAAALALFREQEVPWGIAWSLNQLGELARCRQEYTQAQAYSVEALAQCRAQGNRRGMAGCLQNLALVALEQGTYAEAAGYADESLALAGELGHQIYIAEGLMAVAASAAGQGQPARAARLAGAAAALLTTTGGQLEPAHVAVYTRLLHTAQIPSDAGTWQGAWESG